MDSGSSSVELPRKLHGWQARHETSLCGMYTWKVWTRGLRGRLENCINQGKFWLRPNEIEEQKSFTEKSDRRPCMCAFQPAPTFSYSTLTDISGNKKWKEADYIFMHQRCCFFLYTTQPTYEKVRQNSRYIAVIDKL